MRYSIFSFLIFTILAFNSCDKAPETLSDAELILAIQNASDKQTVTASELPTDANESLGRDYSESYFETAQLAPEYGYEVRIRRGEGSRIGERNEVYFNREGRELRRDRDHEPTRGEAGRDLEECFELVFPLTFIMPDGTEISGEAGELRAGIAEWYENNPGVEEGPELQFPVDIIFEDGTIQAINSNEEMRMAYAECG